MTKQTSKESLPNNAALADRLEYTLGQIKGDMFKAVSRGDMVSAHYYREQYAVTEKIIYAIRNGRIARTDKDVERLVSGK
jgi:DNA-binding ferritin-like protein